MQYMAKITNMSMLIGDEALVAGPVQQHSPPALADTRPADVTRPSESTNMVNMADASTVGKEQSFAVCTTLVNLDRTIARATVVGTKIEKKQLFGRNPWSQQVHSVRTQGTTTEPRKKQRPWKREKMTRDK